MTGKGGTSAKAPKRGRPVAGDAMLNAVSIDTTHKGSRVQLVLHQTAPSKGTIRFRSWPRGSAADAEPSSDQSFELYDIRYDEERSAIVCRADIAFIDPKVTCQVVAAKGRGKPKVVVDVGGFVHKEFEIEAADFTEVRSFLGKAGFPAAD